jgi:hypothetical protein
MINTYNLFAVPVTETTIVIQTPLLNKITNWCEENKKNTDFISVRNGFQEHGNFDGKEELDDILNTFLRLHFKQEIDQVSPHLTDELRISYSINMRSICN